MVEQRKGEKGWDWVKAKECDCGPNCDCGHVAPLVDVSQLSLNELLNTENLALKRSVSRLVEGLDDPNGVISAFSSFVE